MGSQGTASAALARRIVAAAALHGTDPQALAAAAGLSAEEDVNARVPHPVLVALWGEAERLTGDSAFGLHLAEAARAAPAHPLGFAVRSCPSLGRALACVSRYIHLLNDVASLQVRTEGQLAWVRLGVQHPLGAHRQGLEFALAQVALVARSLLGAAFVVRELRLPHARPAQTGEHERIFGLAPRFGAAHAELAFDRALLDRTFDLYDPSLYPHLSRHLDHLLAQVREGQALRGRVQRLVAEHLRHGAPDVEDIARRLEISPRTLQRRLQQEGTSFQEVVTAARRELAQRYLGEPSLTIMEVAFLVGFTEASNFHRAFKRWTGTTPAEARKRALAAEAGLSGSTPPTASAGESGAGSST